MSLTINKESFEKLIREDIEWLMKQPRTLEREHIKLVLESAPDEYYRPGKVWPPDNA